MNDKFIVYTAIIGDYDVLLNPEIKENNVDYVCITDEPEAVPEGWETRDLDWVPFDLPDRDPKDKVEKIKMHPHILFPEYNISIWIDGNVHILDEISDYVEETLKEANVAALNHTNRDCTYKEAKAVTEKNVNNSVINRQMNKYRSEGFPKEYGLHDTAILFRRHHKDKVIRMMEIWWEEYSKRGKRDQLSFEYSSWRSGEKVGTIKENLESNNSYFKRHKHIPDNTHGIIRLFWKKSVRYKEKPDCNDQLAIIFRLLFLISHATELVIRRRN